MIEQLELIPVVHVEVREDLEVVTAYRKGGGHIRDIKGVELTIPGENDPLFIADATPPPCDTCEHRVKCGGEGLACAAFTAYTDCTAGWEELDRTPSRDVYDLLFIAASEERDYIQVGSTRDRGFVRPAPVASTNP